jgi:hypothetical protein
MHLRRDIPADAVAELVEVGVDLPGATRREHDEREALLRALEDGLDRRVDHHEEINHNAERPAFGPCPRRPLPVARYPFPGT